MGTDAAPDLPPCQIDVADARALPLADAMVQLVTTSPPYDVGYDYADGGRGDRRPLDVYLFDLAMALAECRRVLRHGGVLALNLPPTIRTPDDRAYPLAAWAQMHLYERGWLLREPATWVKTRSPEREPLAATTAVGAPTNPYLRPTSELVILASKGTYRLPTRAGLPWLDGDPNHSDYMGVLKDIWHLPPGKGRRGYPLAFPDELVRRLVLLYSAPGDAVLDPFSGTFTTARVARELGRYAIGFDISRQYVDEARRLLDAAGGRPA